ncbi:MAG: hypothetical protein U0R50_15095 [Gaiellales bacterium]
MNRTIEVELPTELHAHAVARAAALAVPVSTYVVILVDEDRARNPGAAASLLFDLGSSGGSDIANEKDAFVGEAFLADL